MHLVPGRSYPAGGHPNLRPRVREPVSGAGDKIAEVPAGDLGGQVAPKSRWPRGHRSRGWLPNGTVEPEVQPTHAQPPIHTRASNPRPTPGGRRALFRVPVQGGRSSYITSTKRMSAPLRSPPGRASPVRCDTAMPRRAVWPAEMACGGGWKAQTARRRLRSCRGLWSSGPIPSKSAKWRSHDASDERAVARTRAHLVAPISGRAHRLHARP